MVAFSVRQSGQLTPQAAAFVKRLKEELSDAICEKHAKMSQKVKIGVDHLEEELTLFCEVEAACCKQFTELMKMAITKEWLEYKEDIREQ